VEIRKKEVGVGTVLVVGLGEQEVEKVGMVALNGAMVADHAAVGPILIPIATPRAACARAQVRVLLGVGV